MELTYNFGDQKARGDVGEQFLDRLFAGIFEIRPATRKEQRQGIDRIFTNRQTGDCLKVEYKTDYRATQTGNAFVETVSVDTTGKRGWAYTSQADYLNYYLPGDLIYIIAFAALHREMPRWEQEYPTRPVQNNGNATYGILVPLCEFEELAEAVISI